LCGILSLDAINRDSFEKLESDVEIEYSRDADWTKETHENCLSLLLDLVDELTKPGISTGFESIIGVVKVVSR
jgi:hypothetical protein